MATFKLYKASQHWSRRLIISFLVLLVLLIGGVIVVRHIYDANLQAVSNSTVQEVVVVESGASVNAIGQLLKQKKLIRQVWAFERYVRNQELGTSLKAGTYKIQASQSVQSIVDTLVSGKVAVDLVTILPGQRLTQIKDALIKAKFDPTAVEAALNPSRYADSPALADKPASITSLEGFLYPDSYQKDATTEPEVIIRQSLDEMSSRLTANLRAAFARQGLSVYQAVTLASIVEQEVSQQSDRAQAAQVFLKRYKIDMSLGSDVTAFYGAVQAGQKPSTTFDSPYNTLLYKGLPPGPISNVSESSLQAIANPASTDWLFFVAGDDGKTYFSKTQAEHEALTAQYCHKLCNLTN